MAVAGVGVGGFAGACSVIFREVTAVAPESATAVSVMSPEDTTVSVAVPEVARSPAAPVMLT